MFSKDPFNWFWELLVLVRDNILGFEIPYLQISYFNFCIYTILLGLVIKVLINSVNYSASNSVDSFVKSKRNTKKGKS